MTVSLCDCQVAHMSKSELEYWDSVYFGPALLFMNQYFDFFVPEYYVLWAAFVSIDMIQFTLKLVQFHLLMQNRIGNCNLQG